MTNWCCVNVQVEWSRASAFQMIYTSGTTGRPKGVIHTQVKNMPQTITDCVGTGLAWVERSCPEFGIEFVESTRGKSRCRQHDTPRSICYWRHYP